MKLQIQLSEARCENGYESSLSQLLRYHKRISGMTSSSVMLCYLSDLQHNREGGIGLKNL